MVVAAWIVARRMQQLNALLLTSLSNYDTAFIAQVVETCVVN
jgi:hypothetical protein